MIREFRIDCYKNGHLKLWIRYIGKEEELKEMLKEKYIEFIDEHSREKVGYCLSIYDRIEVR